MTEGKVLVVQLARLGDLVQTWPLLRRLRQQDPGRSLDLLTDRPLAALQDPGAHAGLASEVFPRFGAAEFGGEVRDSIHRTAVYVTRSHGGVGGRGREVPSYPD